MELRPHIKKAIVNDDSSPEEAFQNNVIRQEVKMKHDLLIAHTRQNISKKRKDSLLEKDQIFKSDLRGMIIGHFSIDEYHVYSEISNAANRRILNIIKERMIDHLSVLIDERFD